MELKKLLDAQEEIKVYYTRTEDRRLTLNQRVNLANDLEADLFLSIHCNSNPSTSVHGTEVLFNEKQDSIISVCKPASFNDKTSKFKSFNNSRTSFNFPSFPVSV